MGGGGGEREGVCVWCRQRKKAKCTREQNCNEKRRGGERERKREREREREEEWRACRIDVSSGQADTSDILHLAWRYSSTYYSQSRLLSVCVFLYVFVCV